MQAGVRERVHSGVTRLREDIDALVVEWTCGQRLWGAELRVLEEELRAATEERLRTGASRPLHRAHTTLVSTRPPPVPSEQGVSLDGRRVPPSRRAASAPSLVSSETPTATTLGGFVPAGQMTKEALEAVREEQFTPEKRTRSIFTGYRRRPVPFSGDNAVVLQQDRQDRQQEPQERQQEPQERQQEPQERQEQQQERPIPDADPSHLRRTLEALHEPPPRSPGKLHSEMRRQVDALRERGSSPVWVTRKEEVVVRDASRRPAVRIMEERSDIVSEEVVEEEEIVETGSCEIIGRL